LVISLRTCKVGYRLKNVIRSDQYCIVFWNVWTNNFFSTADQINFKNYLNVDRYTYRHKNSVHPRRSFIRAGFELLMQRGFLISLRSRGAVAWGYAVVSATRTGEVLNFKRALPNRFYYLYYTRAHRERA
jgi:hypothetical protein